MLENRVRFLRQSVHMSQTALATSIGVSRQTIQSIESGSVMPSTLIALRLARLFNVHVEEIFYEPTTAKPNVALSIDEKLEPGDRVITTEMNGQLVAHRAEIELGKQVPTAQQAQIVSRRLDGNRVELTRFGTDEISPRTIICGCDPALGLLTAHTSSGAQDSAYWIHGNNASAIQLLMNGSIQVAATHTPRDTTKSTDSLPAVSRSCYRVRLADWELGWVVRRGNPRGFHNAADLGEGKITVVNRPVGAGARKLFDRELAQCGVRPEAVAQYNWTVSGHTQVAMAIEAGAADVGIATAGIASSLHLDFIPIQAEQCNLWIPKAHFQKPGVQHLLDRLSSDVFRWDLTHFGPYDVSHTGVLDEVSASV